MARHRERAAPEQQELDALRLDDVALDGARLEPQVLGQDLDDAVAAGDAQHQRLAKRNAFMVCTATNALNAALDQLAPASDRGEEFSEDWTQESPAAVEDEHKDKAA